MSCNENCVQIRRLYHAPLAPVSYFCVRQRDHALPVSEVVVLCAAPNSGQSFPAGSHTGTEAHAG